MRIIISLFTSFCLLTLSGCYVAFGKRSVATITQFPEDMCVINTLQTLPDISQVSPVRRDIKDTRFVLPRRTDTQQNEDVSFSYRGFTYSVGSSMTWGREGQTTIYGVAGGQCPSTDYLKAYDEMINIIEPALAKACFAGAVFKRSTSKRCE